MQGLCARGRGSVAGVPLLWRKPIASKAEAAPLKFPAASQKLLCNNPTIIHDFPALPRDWRNSNEKKMSGVAEKARFYLERSVPQLREWEEKGLFSQVRFAIPLAETSS